jgi:hypothetical protein
VHWDAELSRNPFALGGEYALGMAPQIRLATICLTLSLLIPCAQAQAPSRTPVLAELFTSEGCSSCPPADQVLQKLDTQQPVPGVEILVLSEHVDYWNSEGWQDPFSQADFTMRQKRYAFHLKTGDIYTPELVIDGREGFVGSREKMALDSIAAAAKLPKLPLQLTRLADSGGHARVRISADSSSGSVEWPRSHLILAVASDQAASRVSAGENAGRNLTHVAVVRSLEDLGAVSSTPLNREVTLHVRPGDMPSLRLVAFVQDPKTLAVVAAGMLAPQH